MEKEIKILLKMILNSDNTSKGSINKKYSEIKEKNEKYNIAYELITTLLYNKKENNYDNLKKLLEVDLELSLMENSKHEYIFILASKSKDWKEIYDLLLSKNFYPSKEISDSRISMNLFENLIFDKEFEKVDYLLKYHNIPPVIRKFNNVVDDFIISLDTKSLKKCYEFNLINPKENVFSFLNINEDLFKKKYEESTENLFEILNFLNNQGALDSIDKRKICINLSSNQKLKVDFLERIFKELAPDFKNDNFVNISQWTNIYNKIAGNNFEKLFLFERYGLNFKNLSAYSILSNGLNNQCSMETTEILFNKISSDLSESNYDNLIKQSLAMSKRKEGLFYISKTENKKEYYSYYRESFNNMYEDKKKINEFLKTGEKYFPEYLKEEISNNGFEYYFSIAFCFDIKKFNEHYEKRSFSNYREVIKEAYFKSKDPRCISFDFEECLVKSSLPTNKKEKVLNYIENYEANKAEFEKMKIRVLALSERNVLKDRLNIPNNKKNVIKKERKRL